MGRGLGVAPDRGVGVGLGVAVGVALGVVVAVAVAVGVAVGVLVAVAVGVAVGVALGVVVAVAVAVGVTVGVLWRRCRRSSRRRRSSGRWRRATGWRYTNEIDVLFVLSPARVEVVGSRVGHVTSSVIRDDGDIIAYLVLVRPAFERIKGIAHGYVRRPRNTAIGAVGVE